MDKIKKKVAGFGYAVFPKVITILQVNPAFSQNHNKNEAENSLDRLELIEEYADRIHEIGRDQWSGRDKPLIIDGFNVDTGERVVWIHQSGQKYKTSNMASQQHLFHVLTDLTNLTVDECYINAAKEAVLYMFDHFTNPGGLLYFGDYQFMDLGTLQRVKKIDGNAQKLKYIILLYDFVYFIFNVIEEIKIYFIRELWNNLVVYWSVLEMNRDGYCQNRILDDLWDGKLDDPEPFFESNGLTFLNDASDLTYAGAILNNFNREQEALDWFCRLHGMNVQDSYPVTGLGAVQYSKPKRVNTPHETGLLSTSSNYGGRIENQFSIFYGDMAKECWVHLTSGSRGKYMPTGFMLTELPEQLGGVTEGFFLQITIDYLTALAIYAYILETDRLKPNWADGTDLTGQSYSHSGYYYGYDGKVWRPASVGMDFLMTHARTYQLNNDPLMWEMVRNIPQGRGSGDIGSELSVGVNMEKYPVGNGTTELFAMLELYKAAEHFGYLKCAEQVADKIIDSYYHHGFFFLSEDRVFAEFNYLEPLVILLLETVLIGQPEKVSANQAGCSYIHGTYFNVGQTYDSGVMWPVRRRDFVLFHQDLLQTSPVPMINISSPTFLWSEASGAKEYQFQFTETNFTQVVMDRVVSQPETELPFWLEAGERYRWRMRALNDIMSNSEGYWSAESPFTVFGVTATESSGDIIGTYFLDAAYSNPFKPATTIRYGFLENGHLRLEIYDLIDYQQGVMCKPVKNNWSNNG